MKIKNQQLDSENAELSQKNSQNQEELQKLNQRLAETLCQKENEPGNSTFKEWEQEKSNLKKELEHCKVQVRRIPPNGFFFKNIPRNGRNAHNRFLIHKALIIRTV